MTRKGKYEENFGVMELLRTLRAAAATHIYALVTVIEFYVPRELILWSVNLGIKKNENTCTHTYTQTLFFLRCLKRNFPSGFLPERLLCGGSATLALVFCEPGLLSVKGENPSRAEVFIETPLPPPQSPTLHPGALLLWKQEWRRVWSKRSFRC